MIYNQSRHLSQSFTAAILCIFFALSSNIASAINAAPFSFTETQPDGTQITLFPKGDEHYNWVEDQNGFTVVKNSDRFEYAELGQSGQLNPNGIIVGRDKPQALGLQKHILPSALVRAQSAKLINPVNTIDGASVHAEAVAPLGTVKNLVVMIRFSDHASRTLPSVADIDVLFNAVGGDPSLAPTGSIRDVYFENSYGQMTLDSVVNPGIGGWIDLPNTEAFYANGNSGDSTLWQALSYALDQLDLVIDFNDYDTDNDGRIDSIAFIHSGYGAEWGGTDAFGGTGANRIWSHRWAIQPQWNSNDGVNVFDYHISPGVWGTSGSAIGRIGVISHETGHFFGLPDLYDTDGGVGAGNGIGSWGMMANSWGFDGSQLHPPHFSPWSKIGLGWYTATTISSPGQYSIDQTETNPEVFRIDAGFPANEYLLIENRQSAGIESAIPQGGLAIWHIDDTNGFNTQGYPGQSGWPSNDNHYRVALLQADGNYNLEKNENRGDSGDTYHAGGASSIGPGPTPHPNTDSYQSGTIASTGISITDISASSASMTFCYNGCGSVEPDLIVQSPGVSDSSLEPSQSFTTSATTRNQGTGSSVATTLRYYVSTNSIISTSDTLLGTDSVSALSAGGTENDGDNHAAPASEGNYWVGACVDSVAGESSTSNNCSVGVPVVVAAVVALTPDLIVQSPSLSDSSLEPSQSFTTSATTRNQGTGSSVATTLRYYVSTNSIISTSDTLLGTDSISALSAGGTENDSDAHTAPASQGTYWVGACVDSVSGESDTGNNCSTGVQIAVSGTADVYEPDNDNTTAKPIVKSEIQLHSFHIAGDKDWMSFTLPEAVKNFTVETSTAGFAGDTRLYLYDDQIQEIGFDNDGGVDQFSLIELPILQAGTYFILADEFFDDDVLSGYNVQMNFELDDVNTDDILDYLPAIISAASSPGRSCGTIDPVFGALVRDCDRACIPKSVSEDWIGDGFCDDEQDIYIPAHPSINLFCSTFAFDGGDCD